MDVLLILAVNGSCAGRWKRIDFDDEFFSLGVASRTFFDISRVIPKAIAWKKVGSIAILLGLDDLYYFEFFESWLAWFVAILVVAYLWWSCYPLARWWYLSWCIILLHLSHHLLYLWWEHPRIAVIGRLHDWSVLLRLPKWWNSLKCSRLVCLRRSSFSSGWRRLSCRRLWSWWCTFFFFGHFHGVPKIAERAAQGISCCIKSTSFECCVNILSAVDIWAGCASDFCFSVGALVACGFCCGPC